MHWVETDAFRQALQDSLTLLDDTRDQADRVARGSLSTLPPEGMLQSSRDLAYLASHATGLISLLLLHKSVAEGSIGKGSLDTLSRTLLDDLHQTEEALAGNHDASSPEVTALAERNNRLSQRVHHLLEVPAAETAR